MSDLQNIIKSRLKSARIDQSFTQSDVAEALGIERASYTQIETGRNMLSVENLVRVSEILGKPVHYFLGMGTEGLTSDEAELVDIYRSIPPGDLKENALTTLKATAQQARKPRKFSNQEIKEIADNMTPEEAMEFIKLVRDLKRAK